MRAFQTLRNALGFLPPSWGKVRKRGCRGLSTTAGPLTLSLSHEGRGSERTGDEGMDGIEAERVAERTLGLDFRHRHAAEQVGAHIVRLRRRRIVHVAPDVEVPIIG